VNRDTFNFTPDFEDLVIASYLADPEKFYCRGDLLKPAYFSSVVSSLTMQCIGKYQQQYYRLPTWEALTQLLEDETASANGDVKAAHDYLQKLRAVPTNDIEYAVNRVVLFCRERSTLNAVKHVARCLRDGKLPEEGCTKLFEEALHVGESLDDLGYILHHSVDTVVDKVIQPGFGIRTGLPQFDAIWRTGWAPGWLIALVAPPKRYKTMSALNVALSVVGHAVAEDVIYFACEISQEQAILRALHNLSGLTEEFMFDSTESFKAQAKAAIAEKIGANLVIKHFPIGTAKIGDLKSHARMLVKQLGIKPKMIVVDYADTVLSSDTTQPQHVQQANVYKEVIAMGKELGACVLMPDRCTAEAVGLKVPNLKSFQGAFAKGGIVDIAMGLCATDAEYHKNILRTFVFINRHGPAFQHFQGSVDPFLSRINFGDQIEYHPDDDSGNNDKPPRKASNRRGPEVQMPDELAA
jgi:replicative DNA helicase